MLCDGHPENAGMIQDVFVLDMTQKLKFEGLSKKETGKDIGENFKTLI